MRLNAKNKIALLKRKNLNEGMDLPPVAQVQSVQPMGSFARYYHSNFNPDAEFINYIKGVENNPHNPNSGWSREHQRWFPHKSVEGGSDTIAYGHKIQPGENFTKGMSEDHATRLLVSDIMRHADLTRNFIDRTYGKGVFDKLPTDSKEMLIDYSFNGVLMKFPSFVNGVITKDKQKMAREYKRFSGGKELTGRNAAFAARYGL